MQQDLQADIAYFDANRKTREAAGGEHVLPASDELGWRKGETMDQYQARIHAAGHKLSARSLYVEKERVRRETRRRLVRHAAATFHHLQKRMPQAVRSLMEPSQEGSTLPHMPHLGFVEVLNINAVYPNGARSRLRFVTSNFEANAELRGDGFLHFKARGGSVEDSLKKGSFFIYGRRFNEDGSLGEIDPVFFKDGMAYRPENMRDVTATLYRVGNMTVISERRQWVENDAVSADIPVLTSQIPAMAAHRPYRDTSDDHGGMVIALEDMPPFHLG